MTTRDAEVTKTIFWVRLTAAFRNVFFVSFALFVVAFAASAQGKKVYISVDLEGISGGSRQDAGGA